jgi:peptide/nickel transport system substrate-binding protein
VFNKTLRVPVVAGLLVIAAAALAVSGVFSGSGPAKTGNSHGSVLAQTAAATPTIKLVGGTFPQSLDPGLDYTTQGSEVNWIVYTGLTTYAHKTGLAGGKLIPGLGTALPKITNGGKTYTVTLRKGLKYSDGTPVKASDFAHTMERALTIPWGGASAFITPNVVGASAYAAGKAKTISGVQANDKTGKIVIHLTAPYGPFDNVLAFPALGLVPSNTPMKVEPTTPPPGVGPYMVKNIVANQSYDVVQNPMWKSLHVPGIPSGHVDVNVTINSNVSANALSVLNNSADVFDWADTIPGNLISRIQSQAKGRYHLINLGGSTYYVFMNMQSKPFNNLLVRQAVVTGLNQNAMSRLGGGTLQPACFFLPPAVTGHPTGAKCPYGTPGNGNIAKAKKLIQQSGLAGTPVTVWSELRSPRKQWMEYYANFLNQIGLKATLKTVADANYFTTIGESKKINPQTGFADWNQDFPNPVDFYGVLLNGKAITPTDNENFGQTNDPYINKQIAKLGATPSTNLDAVAKQWQKLDEYTAKKAYAGVFGYQEFPFFTSTRINNAALVYQPIYGWDFTSFSLK